MRISDWSSDVCSSDLIASVADADAYVARLHAVRPYLTAVVAGLERQAANGVVPPVFSAPLVIGNCEKLISGAPFQPGTADSPILADFRSKLARLALDDDHGARDRKSTRLNSSH